MIRKVLSATALLIAIALVYGCGSDAATAPSDVSRFRGSLAAQDPLGHGSGLIESNNAALGTNADPVHPASDTALINPGIDTVLVLKRPFYLPKDVSVSAEIGSQGGEINVKEAGGKIDFPPGALRERTRITMTAKAGWNFAYEFEPHGITFDKPVKIQQDLKYTVADRGKDAKNLTAGYYSRDLNGSFLDPWKFFARVSELRHVAVDHPANPRVAKFYIYHFSGYLMSSGFKGGMGGDGFEF
jgi:hypothetical protein